MSTHEVQIHGHTGPPVLLLPGGAESCAGFFPGLVEGLVDDPGCRVIVYDRPGTGASIEPGSLAGFPSALHALVSALDCGPVVLVGQSLGGAVAVLTAIEHPQVVAGLVLLDPTPINDVAGCARLERVMNAADRWTGVAPAHALMRAGLQRGMRRSMRRVRLRPDCREALEKIADLDIAQLAASVRGIGRISAELPERMPQLPAILVTADRKPDSPIARSHARLAASLGAPLVRWEGAAHNLHLDHPDATLATVRELIAQTRLAA